MRCCEQKEVFSFLYWGLTTEEQIWIGVIILPTNFCWKRSESIWCNSKLLCTLVVSFYEVDMWEQFRDSPIIKVKSNSCTQWVNCSKESFRVLLVFRAITYSLGFKRWKQLPAITGTPLASSVSFVFLLPSTPLSLIGVLLGHLSSTPIINTGTSLCSRRNNVDRTIIHFMLH